MTIVTILMAGLIGAMPLAPNGQKGTPSRAKMAKLIRKVNSQAGTWRSISWEQVKVGRKGKVRRHPDSKCIPVEVKAIFTADNQDRGSRYIYRCSGTYDLEVCRSRDRYGKWGPWKGKVPWGALKIGDRRCKRLL